MEFEDWQRRPNGDILTQPLAGYSVASFSLNGVVRIEYLADAEGLRDLKPSTIQLGVTALQARELGQALLSLADHIKSQPIGTMQ